MQENNVERIQPIVRTKVISYREETLENLFILDVSPKGST